VHAEDFSCWDTLEGMQIGKHHPKLVSLRAAVRQGTLTDDGLLPIEGPILLAEAQRSGLSIVDVFVREDVALFPTTAEHVYEVPAPVFKTIQGTEHSQGVIATVRPPLFELDQILAASPVLIVVLCRLQDPGNVGTILRVGECFGATACIALHETVSLHNGKVVRASAGSIFRLPHIHVATLADVVRVLRAQGISIVGSAPSAAAQIEGWDWRKPTAVLVGNEGAGLSEQELGFCDTVLRIPQKGSVESLNSAIATAVMLYEASKQRG
jgi:TrmH family RNA methyltransferase